MPDAIIVITDVLSDYNTLRKLYTAGLVKCVTVQGKRVYGRYYLTSKAIRAAYNKKIAE